jgi:hypothetical protein
VPGLRAPASVALIVALGTGAGALAYSFLRDPGFIDAPPPQTEADIRPPTDSPPSTISVPLDIPLGPLLELVERAVPTTHGSLEELEELPERERISLAFELERMPFTASIVGNVARLETMILYALRMSYELPVLPDVGGSCGIDDDDRPRFSVVIESPLSLDADWKLQSRARVAEVAAASDEERDRCVVTFVGVDVTERVVQGVRDFLEANTPVIDEIVSSVDTRTSFTGWWETLREPIELDDSIWLAISPERVRRGALRGSGDALTVDVTLTARPSIVFGDRPEIPVLPLPPLDSGVVASRLDLRVDARAEYGSAGRFLNEQIAGQAVDFEGRSVVIDSLRVYGIGGGRLAMEVLLSGDVAARLYLTGQPVIDPTTGEISVPDLDFDVATRSILTSTVAWLNAAALREELRSRARWPGSPAVEFLATWLRSGLNRDISDELRVSGYVDSLRIVQTYALSEALLVRVAATGFASIHINH